MKTRTLLMAVCAGGACALSAATGVSVTSVEQDATTGRITVSYTLSGDPAIVTFGVQVKAGGGAWQSVDDENVSHVLGDVNRQVEPSADERKIFWMANKERKPLVAAEGDWQVVVRAWPLASPPTNFTYRVVNLANGQTEYYRDVSQLPEGIGSDVYRKSHMVFRRIPAAGVVWRMGSPAGEPGRPSEDWPGETAHYVKLSHDYYMSVFETTQRQMVNITGWNIASYSKFSTDRDTRPMDALRNVCYSAGYPGLRGYPSWPNADYDTAHAVSAGSFVALMRSKLNMGVELDLPTEAQWEYAARAGESASLYSGEDLTVTTGAEDPALSKLGRYRYNGGYESGSAPAYDCGTDHGTARVGSYEPNTWGLYDMLGNVGEWCLDSIGYYASSTESNPAVDPAGAASSKDRVIRGGDWQSEPSACRVASRLSHTFYDENPNPYWGVRMCITLKDPVAVAEATGTDGALDTRSGISGVAELENFDSRDFTSWFAIQPSAFDSSPLGFLLFLR